MTCFPESKWTKILWGSLQRSPRPPSWTVTKGMDSGRIKDGEEGKEKEGRKKKGKGGEVGEGKREMRSCPQLQVLDPPVG